MIVALALPFSRSWLEATLAGHVLVQMPLLALSGWLFGSALDPRLDRVLERWNRFGIAGFTVAIFTMLFWMVPRSIDSAVAYPEYEMFKFVSVPCAGAALALSLPRTHPLIAGVLKANVVSMLAVLAWVYTVAPVRLCNSYLIRKCSGREWRCLPACLPFVGQAVCCLEGMPTSFTPASASLTTQLTRRAMGSIAAP